MRAINPGGFRAKAPAPAEDVRDAQPLITVPTMVVCGDADERAPVAIAEGLQAAIDDSTLVVLSGVGHVCNLEAPDIFNSALRTFLHDRGA
jgi:pimeloyl-ACP methyl ester carboxylesterase